MQSVPCDDSERARLIGEVLDSPEGQRFARAMIRVLRGLPERRPSEADGDSEAER